MDAATPAPAEQEAAAPSSAEQETRPRCLRRAPETQRRWITFILSFLTYAVFHAVRDGFHGAKPALQRELQLDDGMVGAGDTAFMLAYAVGQFLFGLLSDAYGAERVITCGLFALVATNGAMGQLQEGPGALYVLLRFVDGLCPASGWTACVSCVTRAFGVANRGLVFGVLSASVNVGNIGGQLAVAAVFADAGDADTAWRRCFVLFAGACAVLAALNAAWCTACVRPPPRAASGEPNGREPCRPCGAAGATGESKSLGMRRACMLPGVLPFALSYAGLKAVNYSLFFWLPKLLQGAGAGSARAAQLSTCFDAGFLVGGLLAGLATDLLGRCIALRPGQAPPRSPVMGAFMVAAVPALLALRGASGGGASAGATDTTLILLMLLVGLFLGGPADAATGAVSADLGSSAAVGRDRVALATVSGIIDGTGALGAAAAQYAVALLSGPAGDGWRATFVFLVALLCLSLLTLLPQVVREARGMRRRARPLKLLLQMSVV